ncbi:hypothetical protein MMC07_005742 [Pseudocyphellaria aurata]|nr:hypothetical protein [Pseudocyphellaria aurata]
MLEQLPYLQTLVVSQLPFFDHSSLDALRLSSDSKKTTATATSPTFSLRLLVAAQCPNTTSSSLAEALLHLPNLVFLDLSNTTAARDKHVLASLRCMSNLQVLKLRQVNLRDEDVEIFANAVTICIRSLDVRGNLLTDGSIDTLLRLCFIAPDVVDGLMGNSQPFLAGAGLEDWPSGIARPDLDLLDDFRHEALDEHFIKQLAKPSVGRLPSEDLPHSGITHLYISDNRLTAKGLIELIKSKRLLVLDAGNLSMLEVSKGSSSPSSFPSFEHPGYLPGIEKLIPALEKCCFQNLTSLRIHHAVVTQIISFPEKDLSSLSEPMSYELSTDESRYEKDATKPVHELAAEQAESRYELPGDSMHLIVSPPVGQKPSLNVQERMPLPQGGGALAPETVEEVYLDAETAPLLTATGLGLIAQSVNGISSDHGWLSFEVDARESRRNRGAVELSISLIETQRQQLRSRRANKLYALSPGMLPKLRTLTLTDVPCNEHDHHVVSALIHFISDCASESELAGLEATLLKSHKTTNSGRRDLVNVQSCAQNIFALSQIVLEMAHPASSVESVSNPFRTAQTSRLPYRTKSSTEDADSEALWSAQEYDFSFFGDEEECGLPATELRGQVPLTTISEKMVVSAEGMNSGSLPSRQKSKKPDLGRDVIQELANFRKQRKEAYNEAVKRGGGEVDGYWPGEVKIVRWHARHSQKHTRTDYYGNRFERGIYH